MGVLVCITRKVLDVKMAVIKQNNVLPRINIQIFLKSQISYNKFCFKALVANHLSNDLILLVNSSS